jgi:hypothetical protein
VKILIVDAAICVRLSPFIKPGGLITIMKYRIRNRPDGSPVVRGEQLMAAETENKIVDGIDTLDDETTTPTPPGTGGGTVPNGGPYQGHSEPVPAK